MPIVLILRALDNELRVQVKAKDPHFDFKKLAFVAELTGQEQEQHIQNAQSSVLNARKSSLQAAYRLFVTSLQNDQVIHDRHRAAVDMSSARTRSVLVHSLEADFSIFRYTFC